MRESIEVLGFDRVTSVGGPADRGQDITAYLPSSVPGVSPANRQWIFQRKHVKRITKSDITAELANFVTVPIDTWVLITTAAPSPEFRRWFETLGKSQHHSFHVHARWRDDLNRLVRQHQSELVNRTTPTLLSTLDLSSPCKLTESQTLAAFTARCRDFTNAQVERYAKSKYIPNLYVKRTVQTELNAFHATEAQLSVALKNTITESIAYISRDADSHLRVFPLQIGAPQTGHDVFQGLWSDPEKQTSRQAASDKKEIAARQTALNRLFALSTSWLADLKKSLERLSLLATRLSDTQLYTDHAAQKALSRQVTDHLALLEHMPTDSRAISLPLGKKKEKHVITFGIFARDKIDLYAARLRSVSRVITDSRKPALVFIERAGSGKTNLLCNYSLSLASEQPTLLLFGKQLFGVPDGIKNAVIDALARALHSDANPSAAIESMDQILSVRGQFLHVFIDGINENRHIREIDHCLVTFLQWASQHRCRVTITCRDIYWAFFTYESFSDYVYQLRKDSMKEFSYNEYNSAVPLYLSYYQIQCELVGYAQRACRHPLLLRFFCEAHGSLGEEVVNLGVVSDIRLKGLFDLYLRRKTEQIALMLRHRNADTVMGYLLRLIGYMFENRLSFVLTSDLGDATGDLDLSTVESLYLRLLDEEVIIEEQPTDSIDKRRVSFVYEEFMEYVAARSLLK